MPNIVTPLNEAYKLDTKTIGGKAYPLSFLIKKNVRIPQGFVVFSSAFETLRRSNGLYSQIESLLRELREKQMNNVDKISNQIQILVASIIVSKEMESEILNAFDSLGTKYAAVRSSSSSEDQEHYSWAGEFETYTFVTKANLIENIVRCWASLYAPRALIYAHKHGLPFASDMAVLIQKMVESKTAGVCFTQEPNNTGDVLLIEAINGQGELLVHGDVTPDRYWISKSDEIILDIEVGSQKKIISGTQGILSTVQGSQQKLSGKHIIELTRTAVHIEKLMNKPQDIEWAYADDQLFILQTRPITTIIMQ